MSNSMDPLSFRPDSPSIVPEGIEVRVHESSLKAVRALEEAERDRRNRLLTTARFAPPNEVEHAHDEAKAFKEGIEAPQAGTPPPVLRVIHRAALNDMEEEERYRRTSTTAEIAFAALEHAHHEAQLFREGIGPGAGNAKPALQQLKQAMGHLENDHRNDDEEK